MAKPTVLKPLPDQLKVNVTLAQYCIGHKITDVLGFETSPHANTGLDTPLALWIAMRQCVGQRGWCTIDELYQIAFAHLWYHSKATVNRTIDKGMGIFWWQWNGRFYFYAKPKLYSNLGLQDYERRDQAIISSKHLKKLQLWRAALATANIPASGVYLSRAKQTKQNGRSRPANCKYEKLVGIKKMPTLLTIDLDQPDEQIYHFAERVPEGSIHWFECKHCSWTGKEREDADQHAKDYGHTTLLTRPGVNHYENLDNANRWRTRKWARAPIKSMDRGQDGRYPASRTVYCDTVAEAKRFRRDNPTAACYLLMDARPVIGPPVRKRRDAIILSSVPALFPRSGVTTNAFVGYF